MARGMGGGADGLVSTSTVHESLWSLWWRSPARINVVRAEGWGAPPATPRGEKERQCHSREASVPPGKCQGRFCARCGRQ